MKTTRGMNHLIEEAKRLEWALALNHTPTSVEIAQRWHVSMGTAWRWQVQYANLRYLYQPLERRTNL